MPQQSEPPETQRESRLADLSPASFGMAMATGIVSIAAHGLGWPRLAQALFVLNVAVYGVLWLLTASRLARHAGRFFGDMLDHQHGPGYFTLVAGTSVLGSQFIVLAGDTRTGLALWIVAIVLWIALTYGVFAGLMIKERKPALDKGIGGGWLLAVVATQSIAVLSALLGAHMPPPDKIAMNFLALSAWLCGGMLYIWMMSLIFYRTLFFPLAPDEFSPPYWINMGAMAISTLAGSLLILNVAQAPFLLSVLPFIKGFTIFYWATGTWWIPMLLILFVWRHVVRRVPLRYDPLHWGAVFPLGMYATGTDRMIAAMGFDFLAFVPRVFLWIALLAWGATFLGLTVRLLRQAATGRGDARPGPGRA